MNSKERVLKAIDHKEPDRIPFDGWFRREVIEGLKKRLSVYDDEGVRKKLGIDIRTVETHPADSFKLEGSRLGGKVEARHLADYEEWGVKLDIGKTGKYFHIIRHPLQYIDLDDYEFPDIDAPGRFEAALMEIDKYRHEYAISGRAEMGMKDRAWILRGFDQFIKDLYTDPDFVNRLLDRLLDWLIEQARRYIEMGVDIIQFGDDWGTQTGLQIPPKLWREYFKPRYHKLFNEVRKTGNTKIFFHSDGKIDSIIPDLIESGIDILNPIQPECMNPAELKRLYGDRLTFHGAVSVQETLPFGTVQDVKNEVLTRIKTMGHGGGFILSTSHIVGFDVPLDNVIAMYDTALSFGEYPLK